MDELATEAESAAEWATQGLFTKSPRPLQAVVKYKNRNVVTKAGEQLIKWTEYFINRDESYVAAGIHTR